MPRQDRMQIFLAVPESKRLPIGFDVVPAAFPDKGGRGCAVVIQGAAVKFKSERQRIARRDIRKTPRFRKKRFPLLRRRLAALRTSEPCPNDRCAKHLRRLADFPEHRGIAVSNAIIGAVGGAGKAIPLHKRYRLADGSFIMRRNMPVGAPFDMRKPRRTGDIHNFGYRLFPKRHACHTDRIPAFQAMLIFIHGTLHFALPIKAVRPYICGKAAVNGGICDFDYIQSS